MLGTFLLCFMDFGAWQEHKKHDDDSKVQLHHSVSLGEASAVAALFQYTLLNTHVFSIFLRAPASAAHKLISLPLCQCFAGLCLTGLCSVAMLLLYPCAVRNASSTWRQHSHCLLQLVVLIKKWMINRQSVAQCTQSNALLQLFFYMPHQYKQTVA